MTARAKGLPRFRRMHGVTLIELMIGMVIGMMIVAAALSLFVSSSATRRSVDQVAGLLDNARIAVGLVERDLRLAGYWGLLNEAYMIEGRAGASGSLAVAVANTCAVDFAIDLVKSVQVFDGVSAGACLNNYLPGTDVLVVRRAMTGAPAAALDGGTLYIRSDHEHGALFDGSAPSAAAFGTPNETRALQIHVYYISTVSEDDGVGSSLRRLRLVSGPQFLDEELVPGVEDLQVELGVDTDDDGSVDAYVTPAVAAAAPAVTAARISVLLHANAIDTAYTDTNDYLALGAAEKRLPALERRRMQYGKTVMLKN